MYVKTKQREEILEIFNLNKGPLSAKDIHDKLKDPNINITTVYRNLEFFVDKNMLDKTHIDKSDYYYIKTDNHKHFMVCKKCKKMLDIPCHIIEVFEKDIESIDFKVEDHDVVLYGKCIKCI